MGNINDFDKNNIFNDKIFKRKMRIMRIKQSLKTLIILFVALIILIPFNEKKSREMSREEQQNQEYWTELEIKNGYISNFSSNFDILGGEMNIIYSKTIMGKPVILGEYSRPFGYLKELRDKNTDDSYRGTMGNAYVGKWNIRYYNTGYRMLEFFHPELNYKEYRNDLNYLDEIGGNKIMEVALSFDKPYGVGDLFTLQSKLKEARITFIWLNEFTEEAMKEYKYAVENYDSSSIEEWKVIGIDNYGGRNYDYTSYNEAYREIMNKLKSVEHAYYNELYEEIEERGFTKVEDAEVLGVVVQGTKQDIEAIKDLPFIKASVIGVITEK